MTPLRQRMLEDMQLRNLSPQTEATYIEQVTRFARYFGQSPDRLGPAEIRTYQLFLMQERQLAPRSIIVTLAALRFLYTITLRATWDPTAVLPIPKRPGTLPVVLSPEEVIHFLECVRLLKHRTLLTTCYAAGLRITEAIRLRVSAIDGQRMACACPGEGAAGSHSSSEGDGSSSGARAARDDPRAAHGSRATD